MTSSRLQGSDDGYAEQESCPGQRTGRADDPNGMSLLLQCASGNVPHFVVKLLTEAKTRWLKCAEVGDLLLNYKSYSFQLSNVPPNKPPAGSIFLFHRKTCRYFRKDGHNWRKKKDGKTVRETHEKLKVGTVDLLNCYYAHSEDSILFQRRAYWLLDAVDSEVVLVHYLEVPKGSGSARILGSTGRNSPTPPTTIPPTSVHQDNIESSTGEEHRDKTQEWHASRQKGEVSELSDASPYGLQENDTEPIVRNLQVTQEAEGGTYQQYAFNSSTGSTGYVPMYSPSAQDEYAMFSNAAEQYQQHQHQQPQPQHQDHVHQQLQLQHQPQHQLQHQYQHQHQYQPQHQPPPHQQHAWGVERGGSATFDLSNLEFSDCDDELHRAALMELDRSDYGMHHYSDDFLQGAFTYEHEQGVGWNLLESN
eukprot:CAMPEP_0118930118 /NCGR_PEP_ID=MMETSP1169-20130426/6916_1 /TAXON_ID=36882 /ORGANISM="Pyramimonas obovata, Strain CCMP722" /LENGTH=419 /DNA_ID=CAMNT_0006872431 /DNA_START=153 /DNA_END=1409 /DNA_ORIENTATION=+